MKKNEAFTLVELLLVVIIIGALAAMVLPRFSGRSQEARKSVAKADVEVNIATALKMYELDNGAFPGDLESLRAKPSEAKNWKGPYLNKKPVDPWGNNYQYRIPSAHARDYDLYSLGPDGQEGNDDINNWDE